MKLSKTYLLRIILHLFAISSIIPGTSGSGPDFSRLQIGPASSAESSSAAKTNQLSKERGSSSTKKRISQQDIFKAASKDVATRMTSANMMTEYWPIATAGTRVKTATAKATATVNNSVTSSLPQFPNASSHSTTAKKPKSQSSVKPNVGVSDPTKQPITFYCKNYEPGKFYEKITESGCTELCGNSKAIYHGNTQNKGLICYTYTVTGQQYDFGYDKRTGENICECGKIIDVDGATKGEKLSYLGVSCEGKPARIKAKVDSPVKCPGVCEKVDIFVLHVANNIYEVQWCHPTTAGGYKEIEGLKSFWTDGTCSCGVSVKSVSEITGQISVNLLPEPINSKVANTYYIAPRAN